MAKKTAEARRAARRERLAASKNTPAAPPASQSDSASTDETPDPKTAATQQVPRELTAKVADLSTLSQDCQVSIAGPYNADTENPHWIVTADGEPLAKIALKDQDEEAGIAKLFATAEYGKMFHKTAQSVALDKLLMSCKARPYTAVVKSTEVFASINKQYQNEAKAAFQEKTADYRDALTSVFNLVVEAHRKNFLTNSPLKDALFHQLKRDGVADPVRSIEAACQESLGEHFSTMLKQAQKWLDLTPEALAEIKEQITGMPQLDPPTVTAAAAAPTGAPAPVPSSAANVRLSTASAGAAPTPASANEKAAVQKRFAFRSRMHDQKMSPKG